VRPIHAKAMPVILASEADCETWLTGSVEDALALQKPAPGDLLKIVAKGSRTDDVAA
jgi:putative SOS response-associated peptidase YedK